MTEDPAHDPPAQEGRIPKEEPVAGFFDEIPAMCFVVRRDGTVVLVNAFGAEELGYAVSELVGRPVFEVFHPADREEVARQIERCVASGGGVEQWELRKVRRDGTVVWVREAARTVGDRDGEPMLLIACEDITELREAQAALERARDELAQRVADRTRELLDQRAFQEELLAAVPVPVFYLDREGRLLGCNRAFEELGGARRGELVGKRPSEVMELGMGEILAEAAARVGATGEIAAREVTAGTAQAARADLVVHLGPFTDRKGAVQGVIGTVFDVTERNRYAAELEASEGRYRRLVEDQTEFVVRWLPDGTRTFVNQAYARYYGGSKEEFLGSSFMPLVRPEFQDAVRRRIAALTLESPVSSGEHQVLRPDGSTGWNEWTDRGLFDGQGRLVELHSVGRDITERKRAEESLRASEERYRDLFEDAKDAIFVTTEDGRWIDVNQAGVELLGYDSREQLLETSIPAALYVRREDREGLKRVLATEGFVRDHELVLRRRDGGTVVVLESSTVIRDEKGEVVGYRGILHDVTERRRLEEQLRHAQRMEAIGQLAGGVAHDFNNLLTVIMGNAMVLSAEIDNPSVGGELDEIRDAAERAAGLTRQLLAFGRRQVLFSEILDLNGVVTDTERMLNRLISEDIDLVTRLDPGLGRVRADPGQLQQVLVNMVINASDAMPRGGRLTISTANLEGAPLQDGMEPAPAGLVCLEVADTGVGIPEEYRGRVFEPFFTTKAQRGTGLGMSTAYGIVQQSGGWIDFESEVGRGTTFRIYLPRLEDAGTEPLRPRAGSVESGPGATRESFGAVLLVEDDEAVRKLLVAILEREGYRVLEARDGDEALSILDGAGGIDLIITDVVMPGMSGFDLVDRLPERLRDTRILFMSGYSSDTLTRYEEAKPGRHLLHKPFSPQELSQRVRELLELGGRSGAT